jgi:hypothetical protein
VVHSAQAGLVVHVVQVVLVIHALAECTIKTA